MRNVSLTHLPPAVRKIILQARGQLPAQAKSVRRSDRPRCGAKTRKGTPCNCRAVWDKSSGAPRNGRCRFHGGMSTGPKTPEGFRAVHANLQRANAVNAARRRAKEALTR